MSDTEKMNEAMYERLGEIVFKASNTRVICNSSAGADEKNLQLLAAFKDLRQMCEFYKPSEEPIVPGCPSLMPRQLPGGFDGVEPAEKDVHGLHGLPSDQNPCKSVKSVDNAEELQKRGAKIKACNDRSHERVAEIAKLANECLLNTNHPNGYEPGQYGKDYQTFGKAMCAIRKLVRESIADVAPDYEMLALQFARNSFDFAKFQEALAAVASMKAEDFPGVYYTPGWLCELAKKLDPTCGTGVSPVHGEADAGANGQDARSTKMDPLTPEEQSDIDRALAREKRIIHWTCYPTKVDLCVMGKTKQNGKVYEVRIVTRSDSKVQDTYGQGKVNGKTVLTCSFTGSAWMLKRILTSGMQALVNYKAKRNRDSRRNYAKRKADAKAAQKEVQ